MYMRILSFSWNTHSRMRQCKNDMNLSCENCDRLRARDLYRCTPQDLTVIPVLGRNPILLLHTRINTRSLHHPRGCNG